MAATPFYLRAKSNAWGLEMLLTISCNCSTLKYDHVVYSMPAR